MRNLSLIDLRSRLETEPVHTLLLALGYPADIAEAKVERIFREYQTHLQQPILGAELDDVLLGLIGLRLEGDGQATIRHVVVDPRYRGHGVGRAMIHAVCERFHLRALSAETDRDAVDFFRSCGFQVTSLGELYPGTERFHCLLRVHSSETS